MRNFSGLCLDLQGLISVKLCMLTDSSVFSFFQSFSIDLDEIWSAAMTCNFF